MVIFLSLITGVMMAMNYHRIEDKPVITHFSKTNYFNFNNRPYKIRNYNYDNTLAEQLPVFTPTIPSEIIKGKTIKLFIPTIYRETEALPDLEYDKEKAKEEKNSNAAVCTECEAKLKRLQDFNQIFINEKSYSNLKFRFGNHPNDGESGIVTYISTENIPIGDNILEIRKNYFSEDGVQKIVKIPFYYEGR